MASAQRPEPPRRGRKARRRAIHGWRNVKAHQPSRLSRRWAITGHRRGRRSTHRLGQRSFLVLSGDDMGGRRPDVRIMLGHEDADADEIDISVLAQLRGLGERIQVPGSEGQRRVFAAISWDRSCEISSRSSTVSTASPRPLLRPETL